MCTVRRLGTRLTLLIAAASLGLMTSCQSDEDKIAEHRNRGDAYFEEEKYEEAIIEYRNVIQLAPNDATGHHSLAQAYTKNQELRDAYWELSETVRLDPSNQEARLSFGGYSLLARDFEEALTQSDSVIEMDSSDSSAYILRGQALEGLDRDGEAESAYIRAVELSPEDAALRGVLAGYYQRVENREGQEATLDELLEVERSHQTYIQYGRFLAQDRERDAEAEAAFVKALELADTPDHERLGYINLAGLYFSRQNTERAVAVLREGIEKAEDKLDLIYLLAAFHRSQGDDETAVALLQQATEADPESPRPYLTLSAYHGRAGDLDSALEAAEQALAIAPDDFAARLRKAELLVDLGYRGKDGDLLAQGRTIVEAVLASEPTSPEALFVQAKIQLAEEEAEAAVTSLRGAIDGRPDWAQAHFVLASALLLENDRQGARAELARSVELDPSLLQARRLLARVHANLGEHEYAIEQGRIYLNEESDHAATRILVAQSLVRLGRVDEAFAELDKVPEEARGFDELYAVGRIHMSRDEYDEARASLLAASELMPNQPQILRALLRLDALTGQLGASAERVRAAVAASPDDPDLVQLEGLVHAQLGDLASAEASFKRAIELEPGNVGAYQQLANLYRVTGRLDETIATFQKALEVDPTSARTHHFLAVLYEFNGKPADAARHYEEAIRHDDSLAEAKNNLAYLLAESGESLDKALDLAQEAKAMMPTDANAADTLGWVLYKRGVPSAAVGYLREAEEAMEPDDENLGLIRHHLALAYESNGENEKAIASLERALSDLDRQRRAIKSRGAAPGPEPGWAAEVRAMNERLGSRS